MRHQRNSVSGFWRPRRNLTATGVTDAKSSLTKLGFIEEVSLAFRVFGNYVDSDLERYCLIDLELFVANFREGFVGNSRQGFVHAC